MMESSEQNYSSLSEFDTSSDSDWLDISSRASEDNDSVASFFDSDRDEVYDRPASRRSLSSLTSSRSGVAEGWEGLIDDADEATPLAQANPAPFGDGDDCDRPASPVQEDPEEEKVKAGLEQSMMSTLSSSRSSSLSNSVQTSVVRSTRDLRLSFPDPLTSSRDHPLNSSSYEDVSALKDDASPEVDGDAQGDAAPQPVVEDPGLASTLEVPSIAAPDAQVQRPSVPSGVNPDFFIALYGSSVPNKDAIVDTVLQKWAYGAGLILSCSLQHAASVTTRVFIPKDGSDDDYTSRRLVSIVDKTDMNHSNPSESSSSYPSLAIVLLPSVSSISLGLHTLYLPIVVPSPLTEVGVFTSSDYLLDAEQQWESLGISSDRLTSLSDWSTAVVDQEKLEAASAAQVNHAFRPLLKLQKPAVRRTFSTNAILLAILSIVIGYIVKGTVSSGPLPMRSWGLARPQTASTNRSIASPVATSMSALLPTTIIVPPSSHSVDDTIEVPTKSTITPTDATRTTVRSTPSASTSAIPLDVPATDNVVTECSCGCGMVKFPGQTLSDLVIRPVASVSVFSADPVKSKVLPSSTPSVVRGSSSKGKGKATSFDITDASLYALSTRIAGSISEYFELDFKSAFGASQRDMQEVLDALQVLYDAIARQTAVALEQSFSSLKTWKEQVQEEMKYRHERAKVRAQELKEMGQQYFSSVREHIKARTVLAKEHAKVIKESLKSAERMEWKLKRFESRRLRRLRRWERRHFKRALRVY